MASPYPASSRAARGLFGDAVLTKEAIESSDSQDFAAQRGIERRRWLCVATRVGVEVLHRPPEHTHDH